MPDYSTDFFSDHIPHTDRSTFLETFLKPLKAKFFFTEGSFQFFLMICDRMDGKSQSVPPGATIRSNFWVSGTVEENTLTLLLFLSLRYDADSGRSRLVSVMCYFYSKKKYLVQANPLQFEKF